MRTCGGSMGHVQALQLELGLRGTERTVKMQRKLLQLKLSHWYRRRK
jgi:hypothetical protein